MIRKEQMKGRKELRPRPLEKVISLSLQSFSLTPQRHYSFVSPTICLILTRQSSISVCILFISFCFFLFSFLLCMCMSFFFLFCVSLPFSPSLPLFGYFSRQTLWCGDPCPAPLLFFSLHPSAFLLSLSLCLFGCFLFRPMGGGPKHRWRRAYHLMSSFLSFSLCLFAYFFSSLFFPLFFSLFLCVCSGSMMWRRNITRMEKSKRVKEGKTGERQRIRQRDR